MSPAEINAILAKADGWMRNNINTTCASHAEDGQVLTFDELRILAESIPPEVIVSDSVPARDLKGRPCYFRYTPPDGPEKILISREHVQKRQAHED